MPPLKFSPPSITVCEERRRLSPARRKNVPVLPGSGLVFGYPPQKRSRTEEQVAAQRQASLLFERHRQVAIRMNELAAHIGSEADARSWMRSRICSLTACLLRGHAEYEAVSDPLPQIPEQRIADRVEQIRSRNRCFGRAHCTSTRSDSFPATTSPVRTQDSTIYLRTRTHGGEHFKQLVEPHFEELFSREPSGQFKESVEALGDTPQGFASIRS